MEGKLRAFLLLLGTVAGAALARVPDRLLVRDAPAPPVQRDVMVGRDIGPGVGIFEYAGGAELRDYCWPVVAIDASGAIHLVMLDSAEQTLYASRIVTWPSAEPPVRLGHPGYPTHNIAAYSRSQQLCVTWVRFDTCPMTAWFRTSDDGGATWADSVQLPAPPAFAGDTIASFHVSSLYPCYDGYSDSLHIVAAVHPVVDGERLVMPAGIWHWCAGNNPAWSRIRRAECAPEHLGAGRVQCPVCRPALACRRRRQPAPLRALGGVRLDQRRARPSPSPAREHLRLRLFQQRDILESAFPPRLRRHGVTPLPFHCLLQQHR